MASAHSADRPGPHQPRSSRRPDSTTATRSGCAGTEPCPRYATAPGSTYRVWIVDVGGTRLFIEAESYKGAGPKVGQEIQQIVDSITFE